MKRRQSGFTLLEVLVAFALLAAALGLLLGALSQASRHVRHGEDAGRARLHVQSLLAGLGTEQPLEPGHWQGQWEEGRYDWQLHLAPLPEASGGAALLHYTVSVRWGDGPAEQLAVAGLRLTGSAQ